MVLIAGGRDKGVDLTSSAAVAAERAAAAVLIGESGPELGRRFRAAGLAQIEPRGSMDDAVARADALARAARATAATPAPATVLLSPAAASFDMFVDYAARGRAFKDAVADFDRAIAGGPTHEPGATDPAPGRPFADPAAKERKRVRDGRKAANRTPAKASPGPPARAPRARLHDPRRRRRPRRGRHPDGLLVARR